MRASSFQYLLKNGVKNLWSNRMMTVASVGTLIACFLIVGFAILFSINVDSIVAYIGEQNEVVIFVDLEAPEGYSVTLEEELKLIEGIGEVVFISKDAAKQTVVDKYLEGDAGLLEGIQDDFIPESFRAKIISPDQVDSIVAAIRRLPNILKVEAPTELTKTLVSIRQMVNTFGGAVILALVIVSMVIITNTIRASVFTRRKEINIMKYVGATNIFIRVPFIVEGILLGLLGAAFSYFIIWGGYSVLVDVLATQSGSWLSAMTQNIVPFKEVSTQILGCFLIAGISIGGFGSGMSMRGYLKV